MLTCLSIFLDNIANESYIHSIHPTDLLPSAAVPMASDMVRTDFYIFVMIRVDLSIVPGFTFPVAAARPHLFERRTVTCV